MSRNLLIRHKQAGATLVIALIVLIVLMVLGVSAAMMANTQLKMAGNLQFENLAKNRAENQLVAAEVFLKNSGGAALHPGFITWASATKELHPKGQLTMTDPLKMSSADWLNNATGEEGYMIELLVAGQLAEDPNQGAAANAVVGLGNQPSGCNSVNLFRVTARGVSGRGAVRFVQSIHEVTSC